MPPDTMAELPPEERRPKVHEPKVCRDCSARIFWAQQVDEHGERVLNDAGRPKAIAVDAEPNSRGNVVIADRAGGIVARILRRGELPPLGAKLRTSHYGTCPNRKSRRSR